jgi:hypothetical protein
VRLLVVEVLKAQKWRSVASFRLLAVVQVLIPVRKAVTVRQVVAAVVVLAQACQSQTNLVMTAGVVLLVMRLAVMQSQQLVGAVATA